MTCIREEEEDCKTYCILFAYLVTSRFFFQFSVVSIITVVLLNVSENCLVRLAVML